jgi:hypothetical protein
MNIDLADLVELRDRIIDSLVEDAVEWFANKDKDHWQKHYSNIPFRQLISEYYTLAYSDGYREATKLYE